MDRRYVSHERGEILPWLPARCARVLDLGCGRGRTTRMLRGRGGIDWAGGVELDAGAARDAEAVFDRLWTGDVTLARFEDEIAPASLDLVLCLDILEHLVDPWAMVARVSPLLAPGGRLVVSVPNIRNWKFVWRLLARGDFRYREAGLLDRTHLRFFVRETAAELACSGGLAPVACVNATRYRPAEARYWLDRLSLGRLDPLLAKQYVAVAEARGAPP